MNRDEFLIKLQEYGSKKHNDENYYLEFATDFAKKYIEIFNEEKLTSLANLNAFISFSRLSNNDFKVDKDVSELFFDDRKIFYYEGNPCLEINLKMQTLNYWTNGEKYRFNVLTDLLEHINSLDNEAKKAVMGELDEFQEHLSFLNCFYSYVLSLLEEAALTKVDIARIGLFKNAYFDILNFVPINTETLKR